MSATNKPPKVNRRKEREREITSSTQTRFLAFTPTKTSHHYGFVTISEYEDNHHDIHDDADENHVNIDRHYGICTGIPTTTTTTAFLTLRIVQMDTPVPNTTTTTTTTTTIDTSERHYSITTVLRCVIAITHGYDITTSQTPTLYIISYPILVAPNHHSETNITITTIHHPR